MIRGRGSACKFEERAAESRVATFIISGSRGTDDPMMTISPFMAARRPKRKHTKWCWGWERSHHVGENRCG